MPRLKTAAAKRIVDLDATLNDLIARYVDINRIQPGHYLFQARSGHPMHKKTATERLAKHKIRGFHAFRRYRISHLREIGVPEDIIRYWVGHAGQGITDRYSKLGQNVEPRRDWARRAGLGFEVPELCTAPRQDPHVGSSPDSESAESAKADTTVEAIAEVAPFVATDEDLPLELFQEQTDPVVGVG